MLDVLLKNKFYRKCKSAIKLTKARIEIIKRKRNAMQKYLKNDVADLLKDGLDVNAYGRAEGLFIEHNLTSCYDLVGKFCGYIKENLSVISKQRECPEGFQEAVSSLIFSAARFSNLPELRMLRLMFTERCGSNLDCYVSKEFVEKLKLTHPSKDATLDLMQDIATEVAVLWDRKVTEQKLYNPPPAFGKGRSNVTDRNQTSERPKDGKLSYISNSPKQKNYLKAIQEDITERKEQETEPEITSHVPEEEFDYKKTISYNSIPRYPKSRTRDNRYKYEGQLPADSRNEYADICKSEVGSSRTSIAEKGSSKHRQKAKELTRVHEYRPDEEERWLDRLLTHYSRKKDKPYFRTGDTESTKSQPKQGDDSRRTRRGASWDIRPARAALSDNAEQKIEAEGTNKQGHIRATSLQPEMLKGAHVHPKLPDDYDDFLAHLAAIRKGGK